MKIIVYFCGHKQSTSKHKKNMTKKILSTLALSLAMLTASAQSQPNRLIVHQKSGGFTSYRISSVDSLSFYNVEGEVRADVKVNKFNSGETGDTLWVAVTKTPACSKYRIDVLPSVRVKAYSDDVIASYFNQQKASDFYDDFTNAQLTGFSTKFEADTKYTVFTLGYDQLGTPCEVSRAEIETPVGDIVGNPHVDCTVTNADYKALTFSFKPNEDVSSYYITIFPEGEGEKQFEQWGPMFGFANMSAMIKQFSGYGYEGEMEHTINGLNPGTDYDLYILPLDADGNNGKLQVTKCKTKAMGGEGKSVMTITVGEFADHGENGCAQTVTYTPNDQTNLHRDIIVDKAKFLDKDGTWKGDESKVIEYLQTPNPMDPNWDQYGEDVATWGVDANTTYIAYSIGQNAKGEWGELAKKEFTTPAASASAPAYAPATSTVMKRIAPAQAKKPGMAPAKTFIQLQEK